MDQDNQHIHKKLNFSATLWRLDRKVAVPERSEVLGVPHGRVQSSRPRYVDIEALSCSGSDLNPNTESHMSNGQVGEISGYLSPCAKTRGGSAHLGRRPAAGEEVAIVVAMQRDVEDAWVAVEDFLGAVAMVDVLTAGCERGDDIKHVCGHSQRGGGANASRRNEAEKGSPYPVDDEDLADAELVLELLGGDGDRVEVTKAPETHGRGETRGERQGISKHGMPSPVLNLFV